MNNLLTDRLIRARLSGGAAAAMSLPEIYEAAGRDEIVAFPALRPHQRHAWHAFLAQLGVIALHRAGEVEPVRPASDWRSLLRALTSGFLDDEPWRLLVADPEVPAFMQASTPGGLADFRKRIATPDDLDILVTSKNHDVKQRVATAGAPEDWVFALVSLQTMAGFLGAGNYGIARMNGGFSARPCLGLAPAAAGPGAHLLRDVGQMLSGRDKVLAEFPYYRAGGGTALLWLEPWSGAMSLELGVLDPYFIEICRRVRLQSAEGGIEALAAGSRTARVAAKHARGALGDFWTPVDRAESKALSVSQAGFRYDRLANLLFDGGRTWKLPPAMTGTDVVKGNWRIVARSVAGGQGKTDGYHERSDVVISRRTASALVRPEQSEMLPKLSKEQLEEVGAVASSLRTAIAVAASGGKSTQDLDKADRAYAGPYLGRFDAEIDSRFFGALDRRFVAGDENTRREERASFARDIIAVAEKILLGAIDSVLCRSIHRYRARARALSTFHGQLRGPRSVFADQPEIFGPREETPDAN